MEIEFHPTTVSFFFSPILSRSQQSIILSSRVVESTFNAQQLRKRKCYVLPWCPITSTASLVGCTTCSSEKQQIYTMRIAFELAMWRVRWRESMPETYKSHSKHSNFSQLNRHRDEMRKETKPPESSQLSLSHTYNHWNQIPPFNIIQQQQQKRRKFSQYFPTQRRTSLWCELLLGSSVVIKTPCRAMKSFSYSWVSLPFGFHSIARWRCVCDFFWLLFLLFASLLPCILRSFVSRRKKAPNLTWLCYCVFQLTQVHVLDYQVSTLCISGW